jgi:hypothetical protein
MSTSPEGLRAMASKAMPVWRPLSEQRPPRGESSFPTGQHGENLRAIMRLREIAGELCGPAINEPRLDDDFPSSASLWRKLKATSSYDPGTMEARKEWVEVRVTCRRIARKFDRQATLRRARLARRLRSSYKPRAQTLGLVASNGQSRARESRPQSRARAGPSEDPSEPSDDGEADPVADREAAA